MELNEMLGDGVALAIECPDRIYLNGYLPMLFTGGQVVNFLCSHRGHPVPSPALLGAMTKDFVKRVEGFGAKNRIPVIRAERGQRKEELVRPLMDRARRHGADKVVAILVAQEKTMSFRGVRRDLPGAPRYGFTRASAFVKVYYFYVFDRCFGPAFIKVATYFPFTAKVCVNAHEWLKSALASAGIDYTALDNGIATCSDRPAAQQIADRFSAADIEAFFSHWMARLPWPYTRTDQRAGYLHRLSILQFEFSLTAVDQRPAQARRVIEALIRDNLDMGRPREVSVIFGRRINRKTPGRFGTRLVDRGDMASLSISYKDSCRVKEYLKEGRALRIETTINDPTQVGIRKGVVHLPELIELGRAINRRVACAQRVAQQCIPETALFERVCLPSESEGLRVPGLRFGDPLVLGLLGALTLFCHVPEGLNNAALRPAVQDRTGIARSPRQASYDLRRLRLNGLIARVPKTHRYQITPDGRRIAAIYTRTFERVVGVAEHCTTATHDCPQPLAAAWRRLDNEFHRLAREAHLAA